MAKQRLDKILSNEGIGTRSEVKAIIKSGAVIINGTAVKDSAAKFDTEKDSIFVNGEQISCKKFLYIMMNKPENTVCATKDNLHQTVLDILPAEYKNKGLYPVGRLDKDTTGLLLLTNDGDFAHRVISPKNKVYKQYIAELDLPISNEDIAAFAQGIVFADGTICRPARLYMAKTGNYTKVCVEICEGMFHQVKKMFSARKKSVLKLHRQAIGGLELHSNLHKGYCIELPKLDIDKIFIDKLH